MSTAPIPRGADWLNLTAYVAVTLAIPVLEALERCPHARASDLTRRRLRGERSRAAFALGVTLNFVLVGVLAAATLVLAGLLLYYAGGLPLD